MITGRKQQISPIRFYNDWLYEADRILFRITITLEITANANPRTTLKLKKRKF